MSTNAALIGEMAPLGNVRARISERLTMPCPSSWIGWLCYWVGLVLANGTGPKALLAGGKPGLLVLGAGIAMFFAAVVGIQRHMKLSLLANSFGAPKSLVITGPFCYSRNPIYAAFLIPIASLAFFNVAAAVAAGAVYIFAINAFVIRREEAVLEREFGDSYRAYKRSVPRWFGI